VNAGDVVRLAAALAVTLGVLAFALRLLRRLQDRAAARGGGVPLRVIERVPVGPRQGVALLQVGERVLVVSVAEPGVALLAELDAEASARALAAPAAAPAAPRWPAPPRAGWRLPALRVLALAAALALAAPAHAQSGAAAAPRSAAAAAAEARAPRTAAEARAPRTRPLPVSPPTAPAPSLARARDARTPAPPPIVVEGPQAPQVDIRLGSGREALQLSGTVGLVVFLGVLTLLPALFLLMTSFTRILIVLHFVRSALGTQTAPPGQLLVAIAVLLTGVVMNPVLQQTQRDALQPYFEGRITQTEAYQRALVPFRTFMLANTRDKDLALFTELSGAQDADSVEALPTVTIVSAFITSELRTSFQMGFVIFLPFVVVDLIVASVLMSMGMFMLPPAMISLPFKLLLFVLADGWTLVVQNLVASFR
jgi:flagellar biosynthetic protein FliP